METVVVHPRDHDGELLVRYFERLGSRIRIVWPPCESVGRSTNLLLCVIDTAARSLLEATIADAAGPAVVGIVDPHNPSMLRLLDEITPHATIIRPIQTAAIAANVIVARNSARHHRRSEAKLAKLEETLRAYRKVEQAKAILMERCKIGEPEAYSYLREQAMRRRLPVGTVASFVVESNELLSNDRK